MIIYDCREYEFTNFWNTLPSCVCKKKRCLFQPAAVSGWVAVHEGTWHLLGRLSSVQRPCYVDTIIKGGYLSEVGSLLYVFWFFISPLCKYNIEDLRPPLPMRACLWMDALPSLFSKFCVCDTRTFSKQINSASSENIMVHFLNSCGRQASYIRQSTQYSLLRAR